MAEIHRLAEHAPEQQIVLRCPVDLQMRRSHSGISLCQQGGKHQRTTGRHVHTLGHRRARSSGENQVGHVG